LVSPSLLASGGKVAVILNAPEDEVVFVDLGSGAASHVKVEGGPSALAEKDGKLYVANRRSSSLSILDPATGKSKGRVALNAPPLWISAPVVGNVLYILTESPQGRIQSLDTRADKVSGSYAAMGATANLILPQSFVTASPDGRFLVIQDQHASPSVYWLSGSRLSFLQIAPPSSGPGPVIFDFSAGRIYAGAQMYSLDLRQTLGSRLGCAFTVPHPTRNVVFGVRQVESTGGYFTAQSVTVFDEEKMTSIGEIEVGDPILALLPTETTLYVVGPTRIYPVDLGGRIPADALAKPKARRVPVDLARPLPPADVKKAETLAQEAQKALEAGQVEDARKKFEESEKLDPLGGGRLGQGMILLHQRSFLEASEALRAVSSYPFRDLAWTCLAYIQMGAALTGLQRHNEAVQELWEALRLDPQSAPVFRGLGNAQAAGGWPGPAYLSWSRSLLLDSKQADLRKKCDDLIRSIARDTTGKCDRCQGTGKREVNVEEEGKQKQKITNECPLCKGCGKTWKRPCVECMGTGAQGKGTCDKCFGSGVLYEPAKGNF
jgi:YVTN family beta-propeller protein